jgi:uncharacterized membrane protein YdjX (TVP38/TMEM64 family)
VKTTDKPPTVNVLDYLRRLGPAAPWALAVMVLPPLGLALAIWVFKTTHLGTWLRDNQPTSGLISVVAFWVLGLCLLPSLTYSVICGWCFGFGGGLLVSILGYLGAACGGMHISRRLTNDRAMAIVREHPKAVAIHNALLNASPGRTLLLIMLLRLAPNFPFAIINFVLGAAGVPTRTFLIGTCIGMVPRTVAATWIASQLAELSLDAASGSRVWYFVGVAISIAVVLVITQIAKAALERVTSAAPSTNDPTPTA